MTHFIFIGGVIVVAYVGAIYLAILLLDDMSRCIDRWARTLAKPIHFTVVLLIGIVWLPYWLYLRSGKLGNTVLLCLWCVIFGLSLAAGFGTSARRYVASEFDPNKTSVTRHVVALPMVDARAKTCLETLIYAAEVNGDPNVEIAYRVTREDRMNACQGIRPEALQSLELDAARMCADRSPKPENCWSRGIYERRNNACDTSP